MKVLRRVIASIVLIGLPAWAGSSLGPIDNFHEVNEHLYRGGQPGDAGFRYLAKIGVNTILDLRERDGRSVAEERLVNSLGMKYVNVPMSGLTPPTPEQTAAILSLLGDTNHGTVFVHCRRGADRTGAVIAAYRIAYDRWSNRDALKEAKDLGMSFFQLPREKYILAFQPDNPGNPGLMAHPRAPVAAAVAP